MKHAARLLSASILALASAIDAQEDYATWAYRKDITLNTAAAGANVAGDVVRFPLLVRLTPANGGDVVNYSVGRGADVRFTKADGTTRLPHQIERWDSAQQIADVWVLVDTVKGNNASQTIRLYWGKAGAADSSRSSAVFDTAHGYLSVWHLGERLGHAPRPNAIAGRFPATPRNFAPGYHRTPGVSGWSDSLTGGQNFDETSHFVVNEGTETDIYNFPTGHLTYTVWAWPADANNFVRLISLVADDPGGERIFLSFNGGNIIGRVWGTASHPINSTTPPALNAWNHLGMTVSRGPSLDTTRLYHNGAQIAQATHNPMNNVQRNYVRIGKDYINTNDFTYNGRVDESRLSRVARSVHYMKLSYETQRPGATAVIQGAATPATPSVPAPAAPPGPPSGLNYTLTTAAYTVDTAIAPNTATVTGTVDTFFVIPALPAGLSLNPVTGAITGTPTVAATQAAYTVVAANAAGTATRALTLTVQAPTSVRPGAFAFRVTGAARPYTFAIAEAAALSTEALTLSIADAGGRTVWSRTVNPARDGVRELSWDGRLANGGTAPAGMYIVRASTVSGGRSASFPEKAVTLKPE